MSYGLPVHRKSSLLQFAGRATSPFQRLETAMAYLVLLVLLVKIPGFALVPAMVLPAAALLITGFFSPIVRYARGSGGLILATLLALISGLCLRFLAPQNQSASNSFLEMAMIAAWLVAFPALLLAGVWALARVKLTSGLAIMLLGATFSVLLNSRDLTWKGDVGIFVTLLLLAFSQGHIQWARTILIVSAAASAASDARTMSLIAVIVLMASFVPRRQLSWVAMHPKRALLIIVSGCMGLAYLMSQAMLSGLLGADVARRTIAQMSGGRDLITAGRTEWAASLELFRNSPWGFGIGVTPPEGLQSLALGAVRAAGGDYSNMAYWTRSVFGDRTDLHSTLADLWAHFGVGGVLLAGTMAAILLTALPLALSSIRQIGLFPLFALLTASWDLFFSPMGNSDRIVVGLIAGIVLVYNRGILKADTAISSKATTKFFSFGTNTRARLAARQ